MGHVLKGARHIGHTAHLGRSDQTHGTPWSQRPNTRDTSVAATKHTGHLDQARVLTDAPAPLGSSRPLLHPNSYRGAH